MKFEITTLDIISYNRTQKAQSDLSFQRLATIFPEDFSSGEQITVLGGTEEMSNFRVLKQHLNEGYFEDLVEP